MDVTTVASWQQLPRTAHLPGTVVVIDLLRATSTVVAALASGAREVVPVAQVAQARQLARPGDLLAGERGGLPIPGFDLSNSPREAHGAPLGDRRVILTTTNGTRAVRRAVRAGAQRILLAALLNVSATARALEGTRRLTLLCAGTDGQASLDDLFCAGALLHRLAPREVDDLGLAARELYAAHRDHPVDYLSLCAHGRRLLQLGLAQDLEFCCREDALPLVAAYVDGSVGRA